MSKVHNGNSEALSSVNICLTVVKSKRLQQVMNAEKFGIALYDKDFNLTNPSYSGIGHSSHWMRAVKTDKVCSAEANKMVMSEIMKKVAKT